MRLYWPSQHWTSDHLAHLRQTLRRLMEQGVAEPDIVVHSLPDQDWNRQWAQSVKPLRVGKRIIIRPSWERMEPIEEQIEIVLDPKQAFGTGHHATTSLLLEWLEEDIRGGESVLDVGTGSGLLAMVALRLGASPGGRRRPRSGSHRLRSRIRRRQWLRPELALQCGTLTAGLTTYDVVLANLDRGTLP
jgi:ribosomal protein L11 methyltransferase